jgi:hypothetical protein
MYTQTYTQRHNLETMHNPTSLFPHILHQFNQNLTNNRNCIDLGRSIGSSGVDRPLMLYPPSPKKKLIGIYNGLI